MCGILMVKSRHKIALEQHLRVLDTLKLRGPDFEIHCHDDHVFVAQTVLHITGNRNFYHTARDDFFAYNGEIYNYRDFGAAETDTEVAYWAARNNVKRFCDFVGPWAWLLYRNGAVTYATDPQGERVLYQYQDQDWLIVCSEVTAILQYVDCAAQTVPYVNKCWTMLSQTPWHGIQRLTPGMLYHNGQPVHEIDSVWSWISATANDIDLDQAQHEFQQIWHRVCQQLQPPCATAISYSGGIDSNLIMHDIGADALISVNCVGKDSVVTQCQQFLSSTQANIHTQIDVDPQQWANDYRDLITVTKMPAQSWSFVGKWLVAKHCQQRVLFTGLGADELFGGYSVYQDLDYDSQQSHSAYSEHDHDKLWHRCINSYHGDGRQATLLMDYFYQVVGVDAPGQDRIAGSWGIETRNPFMHQDLMRFVLNLPWHCKVNNETKPLLKNYTRKIWPTLPILPKMGFAGHANDSMAWMGVNIDSTGDRYQDWKQIAQRTFTHHCQTP